MLSRQKVGLSLVETIVALFLLVAGGLGCLELILHSCQIQLQTTNVVLAERFGQHCFGMVREWSTQGDNFLTSWAIYSDTTATDPKFPGFTARIQTTPTLASIYSPNTSLEEPYGVSANRLADQVMPVKITVSWQSASSSHQLALVSLVGRPDRALAASPARISVLTGTFPLAVNSTATFQADLLDSSNRPINGVSWQCLGEPEETASHLAGMGTVRPLSRTGQTAEILNHYYNGDTASPVPPYNVPGWYQVKCICRYAGREYSASGNPIELSP